MFSGDLLAIYGWQEVRSQRRPAPRRKLLLVSALATCRQRLLLSRQKTIEGICWLLAMIFPQSEQKKEAAPSVKLLMARLREKREAKAVAQQEVPTPPATPPDKDEPWDRTTHPLHWKYGHLKTLASYPNEEVGGEYPGEYVIPNRKNTHFAWTDSLKRGRPFQITYKSNFFYRPPGCNLGGKCEVNFENYIFDDVA